MGRNDQRAMESRAGRAEQLSDVFDNAPVGIHLVGPDGTILRANRCELEMLGYARDEYVGHHISKFHVSQETIEDILRRLANGEVLNNYEAQLRCKDGSIRDVLISSSVRWDEGRFLNTRCFTSDITDRNKSEKRLRESEESMGAQLAATQRLQELSTLLIQDDAPERLHEKILDVAVAVMRSDFASLQMFDPERGELRLLAHRGFDPAAAKFWEWVRPGSGSTCGVALRTGKRQVADDIETCAATAGTGDLTTYREAGIGAVQSTPLIARDGRMLGMISTHWRASHRPSEAELSLFDVLARQAADFIERSQRELLLGNRERRLAAVFAQATTGVAERDKTGRLIEVNDKFCTMVGRSRSDLLQLKMQDITHPHDVVANALLFERAAASGEPFEIEKRYVRPDGSHVWVRASVVPIRNASGGVETLLSVCMDITDRRQALDEQKLIVGEMSHRVKNTLSTVQAIASQTLKTATEQDRTAFTARLHALAAAHDLLTTARWDRALLSDVVGRALAPFEDAHGSRLVIGGPDAFLGAQQSLLLTLAFHELATNAVKYGALSNGSGQVHVRWDFAKEDPRTVELHWEEAGGPAVTAPVHTGFGSRLIEQVLGREMGSARLQYLPSGFQCSFAVPLSDALEGW